MARINHNNSLDTIDKLFTNASEEGIMHLETDIDRMSDRKLRINDQELLNFGTCGYLALELDERLKKAAGTYAEKYGTQFSVSRSYVSSGINEELERMISQMFGGLPAIVFNSTSTAHISIIPSLIGFEDAIILDQQAHMSIQTACQLLRQKGVPIDMIRHSHMEMLDRTLDKLTRKHRHVWYMIDGVYSMFGDLPPMDELNTLLEKYPNLYLYVDDAHGMSWYGKNGSGFTFSKTGGHNRLMLVSTLAKGFGVMGGFAVFPEQEWFRKVKIFGGPLAYSHPLTPSLIGSAIASAKIHLSDEITKLQKDLKERMDYCNQLLEKSDLTVASDPQTPIYLIGMGQPRVAYNMVKRLIADGFFVNPAIFPAVPVKNTGVRFTITRHVTFEDIKSLVDAFQHHYPAVLAEENRTMYDVQKAFGQVNKHVKEAKPAEKLSLPEGLTLEITRSAKELNAKEWDSLLGPNGTFDREGLLSLEAVFSNQERPEHNWDFYYFIIRDKHSGKPVLATFFTATLIKDDMLSLESVSEQIEESRLEDPYYLTSKAFMMGSMLTEGHHYYIDREHPHWKECITFLLDKAEEIQESLGANTLLLRDFDHSDQELKNLFLREGLIPVSMPNSNVVEKMTWNSDEELLQSVSARNRRHIRNEALKMEHLFDVEYKKQLTQEETEYFYKLYHNVESKNRAFNMFLYPEDIIEKLSKFDCWEFLVLYIKPAADESKNNMERIPVAAVWCYYGDDHVSPMIIGMDYDYLISHKVYKQAMCQVVKRARQKGLGKAYLGLSADTEKRKYGATLYERTAFMKVKDHYNMDIIESMASNAVSTKSVNKTGVTEKSTS